MFDRLDLLLLLLCAAIHTVNCYDDYPPYNKTERCICETGKESFVFGGIREKRQITADSIITEINSLLGNNSTLANLTAQALGNLTTANLTQILDEVANIFTNQTNSTVAALTSRIPSITSSIRTILVTTPPVSFLVASH